MPSTDLNVLVDNLKGYLNPPTTMAPIQDFLHQQEGPVTCMAVAKALGMKNEIVNKALFRLCVKGLVVRHQIHNHRSPVSFRGKVRPTDKRAIVVRRTGPVWVYEILQER